MRHKLSKVNHNRKNKNGVEIVYITYRVLSYLVFKHPSLFQADENFVSSLDRLLL